MKWPDMRSWYVISYDAKKGIAHLCRNDGNGRRNVKLNKAVRELMAAEYERGKSDARQEIKAALGIKNGR